MGCEEEMKIGRKNGRKEGKWVLLSNRVMFIRNIYISPIILDHKTMGHIMFNALYPEGTTLLLPNGNLFETIRVL